MDLGYGAAPLAPTMCPLCLNFLFSWEGREKNLPATRHRMSAPRLRLCKSAQAPHGGRLCSQHLFHLPLPSLEQPGQILTTAGLGHSLGLPGALQPSELWH